MIGQIVRRRQAEVTTKYLNLIFDKPSFRDVLSRRQLDRIISFSIGFNEIVLSVAFFLALVTVFMKYILPRLEFEKTVVLLLVIIMFIIRSSMEKRGSER